MGTLVVTEFVSLDGVMEVPGGRTSSIPAGRSPSIAATTGTTSSSRTLETDVLLLGRKTYESFAGAWPDREGPFADKFNTMPKYVVSSTLGESEWDNTTGAARRCRRRGHEGEVADVRGSILVRPHQR